MRQCKVLVFMMILRRLYIGKNRGGEKAEKELQKHLVQYIVIKSNDKKMDPILVTEEGYFEGLDKIKNYAKHWMPMSKYGSKVRKSVYVF